MRQFLQILFTAALLAATTSAPATAQETLTVKDVAEITAHPQCAGGVAPVAVSFPVNSSSPEQAWMAFLMNALRHERDKPGSSVEISGAFPNGRGELREV